MGACSSRLAKVQEAESGASAVQVSNPGGSVASGGGRVWSSSDKPLALPKQHGSLVAVQSPQTSLLAEAGVLPSSGAQQLHSCGGSSPGTAGALPLLAPNEPERLAAVHALNLIGIQPKPQFDSITQLMQQIFGTPVAAVSLIAEELQFISRAGQWACSAGRAGSFCEWILIPETHELLVVENAAEDVRFKNNKFVAGEPHIRFYAGAPLVATVGGHRYGTLCVFDFKPRTFPAAQYAMLAHFAEILVRELERELALRWQQRELQRAQANCHLLRAMDVFHEGVMLVNMAGDKWTMVYANDAFRTAAGMPDLLPSSDGQAALPLGATADFWSLFGHVTSGTQDSYNAALIAMARGRDFTIRVKPLKGSCRLSSDLGDSADAPPPCRPVLTIRFRPAESDQLRAAMPHIGVPAWVGAGSSDDAVAPLRAAPSAGNSRQASAGAQLAACPAYYFGCVQPAEQAAVRVPALAPLRNPPPPREFSPPPRRTPSPASSDERELDSFTSSQHSADIATDKALSNISGAIPSFFQMRPDMLSEVTLGPLIGTGSCGRCFRGLWQGGRVCVKVVDCYFSREGGARGELREKSSMGPQAALLEALLARSLSHPHIVTTFTHGVSTEELPHTDQVHQQVWIVSEFMNRGSLLDAIDRGLLSLPSGRPNLHAAVAAAVEMAGALSYLHSCEVIHGDLTPSNVLLTSSTKDSRRWVCKVADFGLSTLVARGSDTMQRNSSFGTVTHMPPELLTEGILSKSTDAFSFGIIFLEMYYGRRAWLGSNPVQVFAQASAGTLPFAIPVEAPAPLTRLLRRCLAVDPTQRPPFAEILSELQALARSLPSPVETPRGRGSPSSIDPDPSAWTRGRPVAFLKVPEPACMESPFAAALAPARSPSSPFEAASCQLSLDASLCGGSGQSNSLH
ncbi:hypothetical protein ABPG77_003321 [Micractinium sp. CCAP 211/92]